MILNNRVTGRNLVLKYIRACGMDGCTYEQVSTALGTSEQKAQDICTELRNLKLVIAIGDRRETRSGSKAAILRIVK